MNLMLISCGNVVYLKITLSSSKKTYKRINKFSAIFPKCTFLLQVFWFHWNNGPCKVEFHSTCICRIDNEKIVHKPIIESVCFPIRCLLNTQFENSQYCHNLHINQVNNFKFDNLWGAKVLIILVTPLTFNRAEYILS